VRHLGLPNNNAMSSRNRKNSGTPPAEEPVANNDVVEVVEPTVAAAQVEVYDEDDDDDDDEYDDDDDDVASDNEAVAAGSSSPLGESHDEEHGGSDDGEPAWCRASLVPPYRMFSDFRHGVSNIRFYEPSFDIDCWISGFHWWITHEAPMANEAERLALLYQHLGDEPRRVLYCFRGSIHTLDAAYEVLRRTYQLFPAAACERDLQLMNIKQQPGERVAHYGSRIMCHYRVDCIRNMPGAVGFVMLLNALEPIRRVSYARARGTLPDTFEGFQDLMETAESKLVKWGKMELLLGPDTTDSVTSTPAPVHAANGEQNTLRERRRKARRRHPYTQGSRSHGHKASDCLSPRAPPSTTIHTM